MIATNKFSRLGDTFRWKSENVATMEVAQTLGHFPGVNESAVYGVLVPGHDGMASRTLKDSTSMSNIFLGRAGCAAIHLDANQAPTPQFFTEILKYAKDKLPKYAVPVFIRLLTEVTPMHNQKQNKIPLKKDGINMDAIYGTNKDYADAREEGRDLLYWWPSALGHPNPGLDGERYVPLTRQDWDSISGTGKIQHEGRL
jgi:hypothetical protein